MGFIPERWLDYSSVGKPIKNIPVVVFKTPLSERYNKSSKPNDQEAVLVDSEHEFTPSQLIKKMKDLGHEFAVIIDLTYTFRYYDGFMEFGQKHNVQYEKIKCEGQRVPGDKVFHRVADVISDVIYQHKDGKKICGIHCTHGVNRAGYLVCRYMIEYLNYSPDDAIKAFNESRNHSLEREGYIEDLKNRTPKKMYEEWKLNRERFEPHITINLDDFNDNINSFEVSKEEFFNGTMDYDAEKKWSRYNAWDSRHRRRERGRPYRGRFESRRRGTWSRFYYGYMDRRNREKFSDDGVYMPDSDTFVLDHPINDQMTFEANDGNSA